MKTKFDTKVYNYATLTNVLSSRSLIYSLGDNSFEVVILLFMLDMGNFKTGIMYYCLLLAFLVIGCICKYLILLLIFGVLYTHVVDIFVRHEIILKFVYSCFKSIILMNVNFVYFDIFTVVKSNFIFQSCLKHKLKFQVAGAIRYFAEYFYFVSLTLVFAFDYRNPVLIAYLSPIRFSEGGNVIV